MSDGSGEAAEVELIDEQRGGGDYRDLDIGEPKAITATCRSAAVRTLNASSA